jgi:VCBS repeat protein
MKTVIRSLVCLLLVVAGHASTRSFETAINVPVGNSPNALVVADFNGDGKPDVAVANGVDSDVEILLGNGDGTFRFGSAIDLDGDPTAIVAGDFNGDGKLDLAVVTTDICVLLGNGDGTFRLSGFFQPGYSWSIVTADFNGDGKLDLALATGQDVAVLLGNGDGTFSTATSYNAGVAPAWLALGDFNGDGRVDLVTSNYDQSSGLCSVDVILNKGKGTFGTPIETGTQCGGLNLAVGDFNGDGQLDVAVGGGQESVVVVFGLGNGKFDSGQVYTTGQGQGSTFVAAVDVEGDHSPDLIVANSGENDVTVLFGNKKGHFTVGASYAAGVGGMEVATGDLNRDGRPDLVVTNSARNSLSVLLNQPGGKFRASQDFRAYAAYVALGDFDHDGILDLVADSGGTMQVLFGRGNGTFKAPVLLSNGSLIVTGDFNGDGISDIATFYAPTSDSDVSVTLSNGDGTFQNAKNYFAGANVAWLAAGDVNGDGKLDLVVCAGRFVNVLLGNGDGTFQSPINTLLPDTLTSLALGDFNGDGKLDVAAVDDGDTYGKVIILLGKGDGTFEKPKEFRIGDRQLFAVAVGDFNADGKLDLAVTDMFSNSVKVLLGNGDGTFGKPFDYAAGNQPVALVIGDFNLDGKLDIAVTALGANAYVLYGRGDGTFRPAQPVGSGYGGGWVATGDVNGDGKPDLLIGDTSLFGRAGGDPNDAVTVLLNTTKKNGH